jgi:hypothetical protein
MGGWGVDGGPAGGVRRGPVRAIAPKVEGRKCKRKARKSSGCNLLCCGPLRSGQLVVVDSGKWAEEKYSSTWMRRITFHFPLTPVPALTKMSLGNIREGQRPVSLAV